MTNEDDDEDIGPMTEAGRQVAERAREFASQEAKTMMTNDMTTELERDLLKVLRKYRDMLRDNGSPTGAAGIEVAAVVGEITRVWEGSCVLAEDDEQAAEAIAMPDNSE